MSCPFISLDELRRQLAEEDKKEKERLEKAKQAEKPTTAAAPAMTTKSPVSIVGECAAKLYGNANKAKFSFSEPTYEEGILTFLATCNLGKYEGNGKGKTKKLAKFYSSRDVLYKIVEDDAYKYYSLPGGNTKAEVKAYIDSLTYGEEETPEAVENWTGKLSELCQKHKLAMPTYEITESGPPNERVFSFKCSVNKTVVEAEGRTKKFAKNAVSQKLFAVLEKQLADAEKGDLGDRGDVDEEDGDEINGDACNPYNDDPNPFATLEKMLSDETKFRQDFEIEPRVFDYPGTSGDVQCLLKIRFARVGVESAKIEEMVFAGNGAKESNARETAARNALILFSTF